MLFTVDEARALKPTLARIRELEDEYDTYKLIVGGFSIWFFMLTTIRSLVVSTVIVSMFNQEPDLMVAWDKGEGVGFFFLYLFVSCLPLIGGLVNVFTPIAFVIASFTIGNGISGNFAPFVLPIAIAYAVTFGMIFFSNSLINSIVKSNCPKIYKEIEFLSKADDFTKMLYDAGSQSGHAAVNTDNDEEEKNEEKAEIQNEAKIEDNEYYDDTF